MARYRLYPTPQQEEQLREHCRAARYVWNLALEQQKFFRRSSRWWRPPTPAARMVQLTEVRREYPWMKAGSQMVQQQALNDFDQAMRNFFAGVSRFPRWRKQGRDEGFRVVALNRGDKLRVLNRKNGEVWIPKVGWVRFRLSRPIPHGVKSCRVTLDRSGRWHVAFAVTPPPIPGPGTGEIVGVDRGVAHAATLSNGEFFDYHRPDLDKKISRLNRQLARKQPGSKRREKARLRLAKVSAHKTAGRKDAIEKFTTDVARRFDIIRLEQLDVHAMTRSAKGTVEEPGVNVRSTAALNHAILDKSWGMMARRLEEKTPGRVYYVNPAYTSQRCHQCGHVAVKNRENQTDFNCKACSHTDNADVNAARNIAAGYAVTARGGSKVFEPVNREPQNLRVLESVT